MLWAKKCVFYSLPIFLLLICVEITFACACSRYGIPTCVRFKSSDTVFIGRITKIEPSQSPDFLGRWVYFDVEHPLKNVSSNKIKIATSHNTSCDYDISKGQRWLIYANKYQDGTLVFGGCDGSFKIKKKEDIGEILSELPPLKDKQSISGYVDSIGSVPSIEITIEGEGQNIKTKTDYGNFFVSLPKAGRYKVKGTLPISAKVWDASNNENLELSITETETVFGYEVDLTAGDCADRHVQFYKTDLKATAVLSGKVVNVADIPPLRNTLYLFPAELTEEETLKNYVHSTEINEDGSFAFNGIREGNYLIALNPDGFPTADKPFLRTYLPGTRDFAAARLIRLEQGQTIADLAFEMPKPLPQREITGEIVLANGKPVYQEVHKDNEILIFAIYNPQKPNSSLDTNFCDHELNGLSCWDRKIKIDKEGKFSFQAFLGFTYLIQVQIKAGENKYKHGFALIKAEDDTKPSRIVIDRNGRGDAEKSLKENLSNPKQTTIK